MRKSFATIVVAACVLIVLAAPANAANVEVHIVGGAPEPASLTVNDGDTVTFFNDDDVEHTIFAAGHPRGSPMPPHSGEVFGPFATGGEQGTFAYQVDQNGAAGTIIVSAPVTSSELTTTTTTTTTEPPSTTIATTTTVGATSSTLDAIVPAATPKKESSNALALIGFALLAAGIGVLVIGLGWRWRRHRR